MKTENKVYRFKISLKGIKPMIWRRIELREESTFWDLTSAILDAMGWFAYHLFEFEMKEPGSGFKQLLGVPSDDFDDVIPVWEVKLSDYFTLENNKCTFAYDFGDNWQHVVKLEAIHEENKNTSYPVCLAGKGACPPEDCGGLGGYNNILETLQNPDDDEYESLLAWLGGSYNPAEFNKDDVVFEDAKKRLKAYGGPLLPVVNNQPSVKNKSVKKENAMEKPLSLEQCLSNLRKPELVFLAKNHGVENPDKIKKAELIKLLEQLIPQKFAEELIYFTPEEVLIFSGGFRGMLSGINLDEVIQEAEKENVGDISLSEMLESIDQVENEILGQSPETIGYLINKGYVFFRGKYYDDGIEIPKEIKTAYLKETEKRREELLIGHMIQMYTLAMTNLYGVCTYNHLHKVFKKYTKTKFSLKNLKDYVLKFAEKSDFYEAEDNYFYTTALEEEDYNTIVDSDLKRPYYFPTEEEVKAYGYGLLCIPEAEVIYENIKQIILEKTGITVIITDEVIGYEEAMNLNAEDVLDEYDNILDDLLLSVKMGKGLYDLIEILDLSMCEFKSLKDMNQLYALYLDLLKNTRKWPLKGAFYSDLKNGLT